MIDYNKLRNYNLSTWTIFLSLLAGLWVLRAIILFIIMNYASQFPLW